MFEGLVKSPMRKFLLVTICCGVAACATTREYEETLDLWKGSSEASLIKSLGPPADIFNSNGHRFLVYQDSQSTALEPMRNHSSGSHDYSKALFCTTVFDIFEDRVSEWAIKGNNCRR